MRSDLWIALGSNQGPALDLMEKALRLMLDEWDPNYYEVSLVFRSKPWGDVKSQPEFVNAVLKLESPGGFGSSVSVLSCLQHIERRLGRNRMFKHGPRTMDLDVILYGDLVLDEGPVLLPHPYCLERAFVVWPMLTIDPDVALPDGRLLRRVASPFDASTLSKLPVVWSSASRTWMSVL